MDLTIWVDDCLHSLLCNKEVLKKKVVDMSVDDYTVGVMIIWYKDKLKCRTKWVCCRR